MKLYEAGYRPEALTSNTNPAAASLARLQLPPLIVGQKYPVSAEPEMFMVAHFP